ncbi:hypothetical protein I3249_03890 [Psychrobacter sp. Ps1]|uniref:hypothetical protein n=1 Tax=Psychrobacter sp. Ps1 TaxID=2790955 RepID=UPI001EE0352F|nr:hypothetical protein [Psychrobacter sp. Ps1]MCG3841917.1 hypothetical protein [Psychrobacter sp. Ps1]
MKKILVSSILAVTACLSMVGQANAAPNFDKHHTAQVQQQKHSSSKASNNYKHAKAKAAKSHQKANVVAAKHKATAKNVHAKNSHDKNSHDKNNHDRRS